MPEPSAPVQQSKPETADLIGSKMSVKFTVQFWGVRGNIPTPGSDTVRYGGNTACVEMRVGDHLLIFDAGTGLRVLGKDLLRQLPVEAHIFFSHCHWDRIQGFPFFIPGFIPGNRFHLYGTSANNGASMKERLNEQMLPPNFPVPIQIMGSDLKFYHLEPGDTIHLESVFLETGCLNYENRTTGYRVNCQGYSAVYATDSISSPEHLDPNLLHLARNADLLIYDANCSPHLSPCTHAEVSSCQDLAWQTGIAIAKAAQVKQLVLCHYDPTCTDDYLDQIQDQLKAAFPSGLLSREGMVLDVTQPLSATYPS